MGASASGAVIAAAILGKEKRIVTAFRKAHATSASAATVPTAIGVKQRVAFTILQRRGILKEAAPGVFYLDETTWQELRRVRRRCLAVVVAILALIVIMALLLRRFGIGAV